MGFGFHCGFYLSAVFSKIAMQSDCIAMDFDVKNNVYGEKSVKSPVTYSLLLVIRNGD